MAWEISHAPEAFDTARRNLEGWSRDRLVEALTDDAFEAAESNEQDGPLAAEILGDLIHESPKDILVDLCMEAISLHGTCDNGGHAFWIDREGHHTVAVG